ncbi:MAG: hypothetical protein RIR12_2486, partial [Bacteroidota bacterium]
MRKIYLALILWCCGIMATAQSVSLTGGAYSQDFNTLSNTAASTNNLLSITGWEMNETGGGTRDNEQYAVDPGTSNSGDTYSYGAAGSTERALGSLQSGTLISTFGANFTNNTGGTITALTINYTGEQWRLGLAGRTSANLDRLDFQYSLDATSLITGIWNDVDNLDFTPPILTGTAGGRDGNDAANRSTISFTINGLSIPNGATFYIRWNDFNVSGSDDGLAIDDFTITPTSTGGGGTNLSINNVTVTEGNAGTTNATFTVSLSSPAPAGGVTFDIATADGTATTANNDYVAQSLTNQTILAGSSIYTFTVQINGDGVTEANESFFVNVTNVTVATVSDGQGLGTINNDDVSITSIHTIQGNGNVSPLVGQSLTTAGIVTGVRSNGFFIQEPDASIDADPATSEGIFVFTSSAPPAVAAIGNLVQVVGTVVEFIPTADPSSPPQTELTSPIVSLISTNNAIPLPFTLTTTLPAASGSLDQLERFESMRVSVPSLTVVAPTQGSVNEPTAIATTNGFFYGVVTGNARPFREAGIELPNPLPSGAPITVPRYDANPELLGVGSSALGGTAIDVAVGAILTNVVGPLDYRSRTYTIDIEPGTVPTVSNNTLTYTAVPTQTNNEITVASFNVERFYDDVNDPGGDVALSTAAYNNRLNKVSLAIRNVLAMPDVIGMVEVEKLSVLQAIANKVNNDAVAASLPNPNYVAYLLEGNDAGGIDVGFLVKSGRVTVNAVTQYGLTTTYAEPGGGTAILNDRPPLVLDATFTGVACGSAKIIVNHLRSLNGVEDPVDGARVREKRRAQAEFLANLIQGFQTTNPNVNIISVGDYNAFQFNDGLVDIMGTVKGTPTPAANVTLASTDLVNPDLINLIETLPANNRYSFSFGGDAQVLDHILVNNNANSKVSRFAVGRLNADFPEIYRSDANRPERISDHDAAVVYLQFADVTPPTVVCPANIIVNNSAGQCSAVVNFTTTGSDNCSTPSIVATPASGSAFPVGTTTVNVTATDAAGNTANCSFTVTVNDTQAPTITCPAAVTVSCAALVPAVNIAAVVATDNCSGTVT